MCKCTLIILFWLLMYFSIVCHCTAIVIVVEVIVVCICIYIPAFSNIISSCLKLIRGTGNIIGYLGDMIVHVCMYKTILPVDIVAEGEDNVGGSVGAFILVIIVALLTGPVSPQYIAATVTL